MTSSSNHPLRTAHNWKLPTRLGTTGLLLVSLLAAPTRESGPLALLALAGGGLALAVLTFSALASLARQRQGVRPWSRLSVRLARLTFLAALVLALLVVGRSTAAAGPSGAKGGVPGTVNQSMGTFGTDIPFAVPAYHGLEPALALSYSSNNGNGVVGVGWSLRATSYIQRTGGPNGGAPTYGAGDSFTLDGQELVADTSLGGTHSTRDQSYRRIVRDAANNRWTIWNPDGSRMTYTQLYLTTRGPLRWSLETFSDPVGNAVNYRYWCDPGAECYLDSIIYNGTAITFFYETRPDPISYAHGAGLAAMRYRLRTIDVKVSGQRARAYALSYAASPATGRSTLRSVQQFGRDASLSAAGAVTGGTALPPISLATTNAAPAGAFSLTGGADSWGWEPNNLWFPGDVNGDGKSDYIYIARHGPHDGYTYDHVALHTALSNGDGTYAYHGQDTSWGWAVAPTSQWMVGDVNGDGKSDLILVFNANGQVRFHAALSNGDGTYQLTAQDVGWGFAAPPNQQWMAGDVNGDGRSDFMMVYNAAGQVRLHAALSNGDGTYSLTSQDTGWGFHPTPTSQWLVGDPNGDGRSDFLMVYNHNNQVRLHAALSNGNGTYSLTSQDTGWAWTAPPNEQWIVSDINGDGNSDLSMIYNAGGAVRLHAALSNGDGTYALTNQDTPWSWSDKHHWMVGDVNGDGRSDVMMAGIHGPHDGYSGEHVVLHTATSKGDGTYVFSGQDQGWAWSKYSRWFPGDINGDGKSDFMFVYLPYHVATIQETVQVPVDVGGAWEGIHTVRGVRANGGSIEFKVFPPGSNTMGWVGFPIAGAAPAGGWEKTGTAYCADVILREIKGVGNTLEVTIGSRKTIITLGGNITAAGTISYGGNDCGNSGRVGISGTQGALGVTYSGWTTWGQITLTRPEQRSRQIDVPDPLRFSAALSPSTTPDLLQTITNDMGGSTTVAYRPATAWPANQLAMGMVWPTVSSVTTRDGRGVDQTTNYTYAGARYDRPAKRLLGFASAQTRIVGQDQVLESSFRQTPACLGRAAEQTIKTSGGALYRKVVTTFSEQSSPTYVCQASAVDEYTYERTNAPRRTRQEITYGAFGNPILTKTYGDYAVSGDETTTQVKFYPNQSAYIVNRPAVTTIFAGLGVAGTRLSETRHWYDGAASHQAPPSRGLQTRLDAWLNTSNSYVATTYAYDAYGNQTSATDTLGRTSSTAFDPTYHIYPVTLTNPLGHQVTQTWDTTLGRATATTDSNGKTTATTFDALGRQVLVTYPNGSTEATHYLDMGNPASQRIRTVLSDGSANGLWSETYLDGLERTWKVVKEGDGSGDIVQLTVYQDSTANAWKVSLPFKAGAAPRYVENTYDGLGRPIKATYPDGAATQTEYRVGAVQVTNELGVRQERTIDAFGRTTAVIEWNGSASATTAYRYDALGRLASIRDAVGRSTTLGWDSLGRKTTQSDPDTGTSAYAYDASGQLTAQTNAAGTTIRFAYDELGRMRTRTYPDGSTVGWTYDSAAVANGKGRLAGVTYPGGGRRINGYDSQGAVASETLSVGATSYTFSSTYDQLRRLASVTYPGNDTVSYSYDSAGRLRSVGGYVDSYAYDAAGNMLSATYSNGVSETWTYDGARQWLKSHRVGPASTPLYAMNYSHDTAGRITAMTSPTNPAGSLSFSYDALNRLTGVSGGQTQSLSYDPTGNITANSQVGAYAYADASHGHAVTAAGAQTYAYDANGSLLQGGGRTFTWTVDGRLKSVARSGQTTSFLYDEGGIRIKKSGPAGTTLYFGALEVRNGQVVKLIRAGSTLVAEKAADGSKTWFHHDQVGSVRLITGAVGAAVGGYDYAAFGATVASRGAATSPFNYGTHRLDAETGLIYMQARYYDPAIGRFISPDSLVPDAHNPQALNRYTYAMNNPISYNDPDGHFFGAIFKFIGQAFSAVFQGITANLSFSGGTLSFGIGGNLGGGGGSLHLPLLNVNLIQPRSHAAEVVTTGGMSAPNLFASTKGGAPGNALVGVYSANQLARLVFLGYNNGNPGPISITPIILHRGNGQTFDRNTYLVTISGTEDVSGQATGFFTDFQSGFNYSNRLVNGVKNALDAYGVSNGANLVLAGHSLGGMAAQQVASDTWVKRNFNVLHTVTFGSPLVTNGLQGREGATQRLGDTSDLVPYLSTNTTLGPRVLQAMAGLNREDGGYGRANFVEAHVDSYTRPEVWGHYDALGVQDGSSWIEYHRNQRQFFAAPAYR
ncbi:MAG: VCBS repeat-containing protein [Herpetosiphonaceae bacterium]|nr:VCBS repeat-containing protein [Herpetosiphonaceae bacterium]